MQNVQTNNLTNDNIGFNNVFIFFLPLLHAAAAVDVQFVNIVFLYSKCNKIKSIVANKLLVQYTIESYSREKFKAPKIY